MSANAPRIGFYGKIPAAGDFVGRGLPRETIARWDRWMDMALRAALETGGGGGIWRFRAGPGFFAGIPVAGVFQLSRDRVGRRFPLLIALIGTVPDATDPWFDRTADLVAAARGGGALEDLTQGVQTLGIPNGGGAVSGIMVWSSEIQAEHRFATASALAAGGLSAIFASGGPPDLGLTDGPAELDPMALWQDAAAARPSPQKTLDETETLDLDDLMSGLDEGSEPEASMSAEPDPLQEDPTLSDDPLEEILGSGTAVDAVSDAAPPPESIQPAVPQSVDGQGLPDDSSLPDVAVLPEDAVLPVDFAMLDEPVEPDPPSAPNLPGSGPGSGTLDPLDAFLDAEAAPLSVEISPQSAEQILSASAEAAPGLPDDVLGDGELGGHGSAGLPEMASIGLPPAEGHGDPLDALWGDDLPPPADWDEPVSREPAPGGGALSSDERLDIDDLLDGLGGSGRG
ncbi:MAG: type VI secretion system-associated protein TagF [Pseudomonadota bacterium]